MQWSPEVSCLRFFVLVTDSERSVIEFNNKNYYPKCEVAKKSARHARKLPLKTLAVFTPTVYLNSDALKLESLFRFKTGFPVHQDDG